MNDAGETIKLDASPTPSGERVLLVLGPETFLKHPLPRSGAVFVGRDEIMDVRIVEKSVSRRHALIRIEGSQVKLQDLGSANGTFVNQSRVAPDRPVVVAANDVIRFGKILAVIKDAAELETPPPPSSPATIVASPSMRALYEFVNRVAPSTISVLLLGETGSGKEVVAREIHARSRRAAGPFVALNCGALAEGLLESELFGHEAGAFTGAKGAKPGLLESAEGGTVFLDEVGEMPLGLQQKLLRVLDELRVLRVGSLKPRPIDVRFVSATNRDLAQEVEAGRFRKDLFFRLCGVSLHVPPLRERPEEIEPLARSFIGRTAAQLAVPEPRLAPEALAALARHPWPGNIRELRNAIERAVLVAGTGPVREGHLGLGAAPGPAAAPVAAAAPPPRPSAGAMREEIQALERARMIAALSEAGGNVTKAAQAAGISRRAFVMKMDRYGIPRPGKRAEPETPRSAPRPAEDAGETTRIALVEGPRCTGCQRLLVLSTVRDDQGGAESESGLCPTCREATGLGDVSSVLALIPRRLEEEGYDVLAKLSPEASLTPVYRARRQKLGDDVAIKVLPILAGMSPKKAERFKTEAWSMAQVRHPSVARVYTVRQRSDLVYLVMELIAGETLFDRVQRLGPLPPREAAALGVALAAALEAARQHGIVHRNVKPTNVLLGEDGKPRLIDFGLAKGVSLAGPGVTTEGEPLGTIRYMPPEQLRNARAADHRSDLYALGATLWHALTATLPHAGLSDADLLKRALGGELPPLDPASLAKLETPVAALLTRVLDVDPAKRPQTGAELGAEIVRAFRL